MSVDADRVVNLCQSLHELWSLPAQIALALWLLYTQARERRRGWAAPPTASLCQCVAQLSLVVLLWLGGVCEAE